VNIDHTVNLSYARRDLGPVVIPRSVASGLMNEEGGEIGWRGMVSG